MNIVEKKWLYSRKSVCIREKVDVIGESGCIRAKWGYSGKIGCIRAKCLYSVNSGLNLKLLYSGRVVVFGQKWLY